MKAPHFVFLNVRSQVAVMALLLSMLFWACGGSGKKDEFTGADNSDVNIDQLLGIEDGGDQNTSFGADNSAPSESEEDEVLRLLGIKKDDPSDETPVTRPVFIDEENPDVLQQRVRELQDDLSKRDEVIRSLRNEVSSRDQTINQLRSGGASRRSLNISSASNSSYQNAFATYQARRYREAINQFTSLLESNIRQSLADNCQYWIGECYYALKNYDQAVVEFEKVFRYSESNKSDDALLKLGLTYLRMNKPGAAKSQFELLIANHPGSEFVGLAQRHLSKL